MSSRWVTLKEKGKRKAAVEAGPATKRVKNEPKGQTPAIRVSEIYYSNIIILLISTEIRLKSKPELDMLPTWIQKSALIPEEKWWPSPQHFDQESWNVDLEANRLSKVDERTKEDQ